MRLPRLLLLALPAAFACAVSAAADTVVLRPSVRVAPGAPVTLADVAELDGATARRFAGVEIARGADKAFEIDLAAVREKMAEAAGKDPFTKDAAARGDLASLRFRGERVVVRPARGAQVDAKPLGPSTTVRAAEPKRVEGIDPARHAGDGTPLGVICELLRNAFGPDGADLRLHIPASELARLAPKPGHRHEVSARSALRSDFVSFEVVSLDGDHHASRETVRITVRLLREVCVATDDARRGKPLGQSAFTLETREIAPSLAARIASPDAVAGASLVRSLDAGIVITADDLAKPIAVRRNDRVIVRREVGLVAIELEAIALEDGKPGDRIPLQRAGAPKGRASRARQPDEPDILVAEVVGNGRAVIR
jgi:flagella basal body P-ring formation protein FlgA